MKEKTWEYLFMFAIWVWSYFNPVIPTIAMIGFFIIGDTILGILAAKKQGALTNKVSKWYRMAIDKFISYGVVILVAHVIERHILLDFPSLKLIAGYLIFIELKSIDENFKVISNISIFGAITKIIKPK